jgi:hypothetical protein
MILRHINTNLDPTFYAVQMQNPDVLTHAQMKRHVDANKLVEAQRPDNDGLMDINTFEFIPKINLPNARSRCPHPCPNEKACRRKQIR